MASPTPALLAKYRELKQECESIQSKLIDFEVERSEHKLVEETLEPLDPDRRAYRLVGGVLVERTVKEVLPSVQSNRQNLDKVIENLKANLESKQKETTAFRAEHNLPTDA